MPFDPPDNVREPVQPIIIGITGKKGSGKDAVAAFLVQHYRFRRIAFADKLKEVCMDVFGLTHEQMHGSIKDKETVDPRWSTTPRHILQHIGTEGFRGVHKAVWVRYVLRQIDESDHPLWVIPDVRFLDEADAVRDAGGVVWKVQRPNISTGIAETHASETEIDKIVADLNINNDLSLRALEAKITLLMEQPNSPVRR